MSIGKRIKELRDGIFSQRDLAERAGVSIQLIRALEQEARTSATIGSLQKIAKALDVPLSQLLGEKTSLPDNAIEAGVVAMRTALTPVDDLTGDYVDESALTLEAAEDAVKALWDAYWFGRYDMLGALIPPTLSHLRATHRAVRVSDRPRAAELLASALQAAGDTLIHLGQPDAGYLGVREALQVAEHGNDPLLPSSLRISVAWQMLTQGRYSESEKVATVAAQKIEPRGDVSDSQLAAYGLLAITGATAAARSLDAGAANVLLDVARDSADRLGYERADHNSTFGRVKISMLAVDIRVVQDDYAGALKAARDVPREKLPIVTHARHLADVALAHMRLKHNSMALNALLSAENVAPRWMSHQTLPKQIVGELLTRERPSRLRELATRIGAAPN